MFCPDTVYFLQTKAIPVSTYVNLLSSSNKTREKEVGWGGTDRSFQNSYYREFIFKCCSQGTPGSEKLIGTPPWSCCRGETGLPESTQTRLAENGPFHTLLAKCPSSFRLSWAFPPLLPQSKMDGTCLACHPTVKNQGHGSSQTAGTVNRAPGKVIPWGSIRPSHGQRGTEVRAWGNPGPTRPLLFFYRLGKPKSKEDKRFTPKSLNSLHIPSLTKSNPLK